MKLLSIVVPAYNVEKYLNQCLSSLEQEESLPLLEVLIVNDGSTDRTKEIAEEYCKRYPRSFFLFNKENGGHGSGINYGIQHATGKYFKVLDGDDWFNTNELPAFLHYIGDTEADMIASDFFCVQDGTNRVIEKKYGTKQREQYGKTYSLADGKIGQIIKMHSLTIRTEILQKNEIRLDENSFYVDYEYIAYPIPFVKTVAFYKAPLYMYRMGRGGQSVAAESMLKNRLQHEQVLWNLVRFTEERRNVGDHAEVLSYLSKVVADMEAGQIQIYLSMPTGKNAKSEIVELEKRIKQQCKAAYRSCRKKSIWLLRWSGYRLYTAAALTWKWIHKMSGDRNGL